MAIDRRQGGKVQASARREDAVGTRVDPYPYIGIIKNNVDPLRTGRLSVWIPDFGGNETDEKNWRTVNYASPYMGTTNIPVDSGTANNWKETPHTYGMWMIPPDIGVEVICIFIGGDPLNGYWIACTNSNHSRHMLPGMASSYDADFSNSDSDIKKSYNNLLNPKLGAPVTEFNPNDEKLAGDPGFLRNPKPIHERQYNVLKVQGLDRDRVRGLTSSSSQREAPSNVFGISTPGRPLTAQGIDPKDDKALLKQIKDGLAPDSKFVYKTRQGGHTFVMDDGDFLGNDQLVRLRTASGHQLLLADSGKVVYLAHGDGTAWMEFGIDGRIQLYSKAGIDVRTEGDFNLKADKDIVFDAGGSLKIRTEKDTVFNTENDFELKTGGRLDINTGGDTTVKSENNFYVDVSARTSLLSGSKTEINGSKVDIQNGGGVKLEPVESLTVNTLPDTKLNTALGNLWVNEQGQLRTITKQAPSHEPSFKPTVGVAGADIDSDPSPTLQSKGPGPYPFAGASGITVANPATDKDLRNQPNAQDTIGLLTKTEVTSYFAQIARSESSNNYSAENSIGYLGKYQFGYLALIDAGLVKSSVTSNSQLDIPDNWISKTCGSKQDFLKNETLQEDTMYNYTLGNYNSLVKNGVINAENKGDSQEVAGWLATAHLLGPGGAKKVAQGEPGADQFGTSGLDYFQKGKYSVAVLAQKLPAIQAG